METVLPGLPMPLNLSWPRFTAKTPSYSPCFHGGAPLLPGTLGGNKIKVSDLKKRPSSNRDPGNGGDQVSAVKSCDKRSLSISLSLPYYCEVNFYPRMKLRASS